MCARGPPGVCARTPPGVRGRLAEVCFWASQLEKAHAHSRGPPVRSAVVNVHSVYARTHASHTCSASEDPCRNAPCARRSCAVATAAAAPARATAATASGKRRRRHWTSTVRARRAALPMSLRSPKWSSTSLQSTATAAHFSPSCARLSALPGTPEWCEQDGRARQQSGCAQRHRLALKQERCAHARSHDHVRGADGLCTARSARPTGKAGRGDRPA